MKDVSCKILQNAPVAPGVFHMVLQAPSIAAAAQPGQFVNVQTGLTHRILRRPISICDCDNAAGTLTLLYEVRGEGTLWLSAAQTGASLQVLGPLGNGFPMEGASLAVCGGGIGTFPLLYALKAHPAPKKLAFLGFRTKDAIALEAEFRAAADDVILCTDDGTEGQRGLVTQPLAAALQKGTIDTVFACGPRPMLQAVDALCKAEGLDPWLSMEERMGCGFGICLVCACKVKKGDDFTYAHCCTDGPVFRGSTIIWER